jgi:hypothetical protein
MPKVELNLGAALLEFYPNFDSNLLFENAKKIFRDSKEFGNFSGKKKISQIKA